IQVADDGCGIPPHELEAAVLRHATSKIEAEADLHALMTLGFRGEALSAICAVADVEITSATLGSSMGARLAVREGRDGGVEPHARRPGTTVSVLRLFERVPARQKYQRAASAETAWIGHLMQRYALAYPEIAFSLLADRRRILTAPGNGDPRD